MARPSSTPANGNGRPPGASGRRLPGRHSDDGPPGPSIWGISDTLRSRANASGGPYLADAVRGRIEADGQPPALPDHDSRSPQPARQIKRRNGRSEPRARNGGSERRASRRQELDVLEPSPPRDLGWRRLRRALARPPATGGPGRSGGLPVSEATVARIGATLLWVLVALAALGGIRGWLSPSSGDSGTTATPAPGEQPDGRWAAAGFAERFVAAYLASGSDGSGLAPYLGYTPDLPPTAEPAAVTGAVRVVDVRLANPEDLDYWSVTVAAGDPGLAAAAAAAAQAATGSDPESADLGAETGETSETGEDGGAGAGQAESFWQVSVDTSGDRPVAVGLPAPVAAPADPEQLALAVTLGRPPADDPMADSVGGFLAAYLCGAPDLDRYLHPNYQHASAGAPTPADPPVCEEVEIVRWGTAPAVAPEGERADADEERQVVVAEVTLDSGSDARRATYGLTLVQRDERWEVAALLPAPPVRREGA